MTVPWSLCSPPMERGSFSDSGLGLPWASLTGSHRFLWGRVPSWLLSVQHSSVCRVFLRERLCHPFFPLCTLSWGPKGFCSPPWAWALLRLLWYTADRSQQVPSRPILSVQGERQKCCLGTMPFIPNCSPVTPQELRKWRFSPLPGSWHFKLERGSC